MISQIAAQCRKLLPVIAVKILDESTSLQREMALIKVKTLDRNARDEVIQMANIFRANIIDVSRETLTVAIFGDRDKTEALVRLLRDFGVLEIARTGTIAIERGRSTIYDDNKIKEEYNYGKMYYEKDCDINYLNGKKIAIIGYGSQGHAHALNLKDSGCDVCVGLRAGSKNWKNAEDAGLKVMTVADAAKWGDIVMMLINDEVQADVYKRDIEPNLVEGNALAFAHGFNIRYQQIRPQRAWTCSWLPLRAPVIPSAPPMSTARECPAWWPWSRTPPATPIRSLWPTSPASAVPGPA